MRPLYVRDLTTKETKTLQQGLRSTSAFEVRRSQILLKSAEGQKSSQIAAAIGCSDQSVRVAVRAFEQEGLGCLVQKSHARHDQAPLINEAGCARLQELVRLSPRSSGYETSVWTRPLLAQQLHQEGHTTRVLSATSISNALERVGISWRRAKKWIHSPDRHYEHRKKDETN
jgi:transposase